MKFLRSILSFVSSKRPTLLAPPEPEPMEPRAHKPRRTRIYVTWMHTQFLPIPVVIEERWREKPTCD